MNGYSLDNHQLQIKASHKGADAAEERRKEDAAKKAGGTKIIIKNLPFEASVSSAHVLLLHLLTHNSEEGHTRLVCPLRTASLC
jgi:multiple RNA-binding domain-containing protein 1